MAFIKNLLNLLIILSIVITCVYSSFVCECVSKSKHIKGENLLTILQQPYENITVVCSGDIDFGFAGDYQNNNMRLDVSRNWQNVSTLNFTRDSNNFEVTIDSNSMFTSDLTEVPSFEFVYFDCQVYLLLKDANDEDDIKTLYHFKVYIIPSLFLSAVVNGSYSVAQNVIFVPSPCNNDIMFGVDISSDLDGMLYLYGRFGNEIFLAAPMQMSQSLNEKIFSTEDFKLLVLPQHLILLFEDGTMYKANLDVKSIITFSDFRISLSPHPVLSARSVYCPVINSSQHLFETVITVEESGNQFIVNLIHFTYENSTVVSINIDKTDASDISDAWFDFSRKNVVLLFKHREEEPQVKVISTVGRLNCKPWIFHQRTEASFEKFRIKLNQLYLDSQDEKFYTSWSSTDGGCTWQPHFHELPSFRMRFLHSDTMLFQTDNNALSNITKASIDTGISLLWTDFGVLSLQTHINHKSSFPFYLNKRIPESDNPLTGQDATLVKHIGNETTFKMTLSLNASTFPASWKDSHIVSFKESISCLVLTVHKNEANLSCRLLSDGYLSNKFMLQKHTWFNAFYYSAKAHCVDVTYQNNTMISLQSPIYANISYVVYQKPLRQVPVLKLDANDVILLENIQSSDLSDTTRNLCFYEQFKSLQNLLLGNYDFCPLSYEIFGVDSSLIYMDVADKLIITARVTVKPTYPAHEAVPHYSWLHAQLSNSGLVSMRVKRRKTVRYEEIQIHIQQPWVETTLNLLTISPSVKHKQCQFKPSTFQILNACPPDKSAIFEYPDAITPDQLSALDTIKDSSGIIRVFNLPTNYQPPSSQGRGIPQTKHVYNADPSVPMRFTKYLDEQIEPTFKQCRGLLKRSLCNCTVSMTTSTKISQSDCISKVYRLIYREKLVPRLYLRRQNKNVIFDELLELTELNSRTDYNLINSVTSGNTTELISMHSNTSIEMKGSGLYHFKVDVIKRNISFCNFQTEFLVYVDGAPLPYPVDDVIRACTAFVFGFILLALFLYQYIKPSSDEY